MKYDSPKQIRRRQNDAPKPRRARQPQQVKVMTDEQWSAVCDFHIAYLRDRLEAGNAASAASHAQALVHMAIQRRACELMRDFELLSVWKAMDIARHELCNVAIEVAAEQKEVVGAFEHEGELHILTRQAA